MPDPAPTQLPSVPALAPRRTPAEIDALIASMSVDEKASLTVGGDAWSTRPVARVGIPSVVVTDGPAGARGPLLPGVGEQVSSLNVPCGTALGATWDPELLEEVGTALGQQTRTKGCRVLLAPTVNTHRSPLAGRNFECYSEDPLLAGRLAAGFVRGVQSNGVATTVKHFVANEQETERMTIDTIVDERTLREIYLRPFGLAVTEGGSLGIMSAYNRLEGEFCAHNRRLLTDILRGEWGFDGFVVTDWYAAADTLRSAEAGLDLEMPAPSRAYGRHLAAAVREGRVPEALLDDVVRRLLTVWDRLGALDEEPAPPTPDDRPEHRDLARRTSIESMVLLRNDGTLPLRAAELRSVALIGPNAVRARTMGGGSAEVQPHHRTAPVDVLRQRLGDGVQVTVHQGCDIERTVPPIDGSQLRTRDGSPGVAIEILEGTDLGGPVVHRTRRSDGRIMLVYRQDEGVPKDPFSFRAHSLFTPTVSGPHALTMVQVGTSRLLLDGRVVLDGITEDVPLGVEYFGMGSVEMRTVVDLEAGRDYELELEYVSETGLSWAHGGRVGCSPILTESALDDAVAAAAAADVAIVVVGTNDDWETEGHDRTTLDLPGRQAELIERVTAANPRTVVVLNTGAPVTLDWAEGVPAVLQVWFGGQEMAHALADVLLGAADPGGRLPLTFPRRLADNPSFGNFPGEHGQVRYGEGMLVGYRWYDTRDIEPAFPFGHGLSYTTFSIGAPTVVAAEGPTVTLDVPVTNTGDRSGTEVVQVYVARPDSSVSRPAQELRGFAKVHLAPGESTVARIVLGHRAFAHWDPGDRYRDARRPGQGGRTEVVALTDASRGWQVEPGRALLHVGRSSRDVVHTVEIQLPA